MNGRTAKLTVYTLAVTVLALVSIVAVAFWAPEEAGSVADAIAQVALAAGIGGGAGTAAHGMRHYGSGQEGS